MLMPYRMLWRGFRVVQSSCKHSTSVTGLNPAAVSLSAENNSSKARDDPVEEKQQTKKTSLINAAFESIKTANEEDDLDSKISAAPNAETLLNITQMKGINRNLALKIVSKLADLTTTEKIKVAEFEGDPRFIQLCRSLGHDQSGSSKIHKDKSAFSDLGVVLGVAGDDEAAKLINTITVPQMIKVLSSLAYKKRRSLPLLRSLAFNLGKSNDILNIKEGADILYACAQLSYQDEVLFMKVCSDISRCIKENTKPAVVKSITTSLGILRYKDSVLLNSICDWTVDNFSVCRVQDLVSLVLTLASVNHIPANVEELFKNLEKHLDQTNMSPAVWLDTVWALVILSRASSSQVSSVLSAEFQERLASISGGDIPVTSKLKLLNVNSAARLLIEDYNGPTIEQGSDILKIEVPRSKEKQALVTSVLDTLSNLLPSAVYMNSNVNTGLGYIIDGECVVDSNLTPLPLIDKKTGNVIDRSQSGIRKGTRIAILVLDYHDLTRGESSPVGLTDLFVRLTKKSGYKVITVPYNEFNPRDKLVIRVQYLEQHLKNVVKSNV